MMNRRQLQGFTLVEMIVVIVITGIIGSIVAIFLRAPVQGYVDSARRAEMTDIADTALRRIARDLRLALPNSVRISGTCGGTTTCFIEFIPTSGGGRYRDATDSVGGGNVLRIGSPVTKFDVLGNPPTLAAGDQIVVYNMSSNPADPNPNAYVGTNRAAGPTISGNTITIPSTTFPFSSCIEESGYVVGGCRFQVAQLPVTYACSPVAGGAGGTLTRWQESSFSPTQPVTVPAGQPVLASNVSFCNFTYASGISQRSGLVTMHLTISEQGENVNLYAATHVNNVP